MRLSAEAAVIVTSILLAFAIEAWWDGRAQRQLVADQRGQLYAQMQANSELLEVAAMRSANSLGALRAIVSLVGPEPGAASSDSLGALIDRGFGGAVGHLHTNSVEALLGSGEFLLATDPGLHAELMSFQSVAQQFARDDALFLASRTRFAEFLGTVTPFAFVSGRRGAHEGTDFEVPMNELLTDPRLEGMAGSLAVRSQFMGRRVEELRAVVDSIIMMLERLSGKGPG